MNNAVGIISLVGVLTIAGYFGYKRVEVAEGRAFLAEQRVALLESEAGDIERLEAAVKVFVNRVLEEVRRLRLLVRSLGGDPGGKFTFASGPEGQADPGRNGQPPPERDPPPKPEPPPPPEPKPQPSPSPTLCVPMTDVCV